MERVDDEREIELETVNGSVEPPVSPAGTPEKPRGRPFAPGSSGNPLGRPKGSRNKATLAAEMLLEGEADAITRKALDLALEGDLTAIRLCLERIVPPRRDRLVSFELPEIETTKDAIEASAVVLSECGEGVLSIREAADVMALIAAHGKLLELSELEDRLIALEKRVQP